MRSDPKNTIRFKYADPWCGVHTVDTLFTTETLSPRGTLVVKRYSRQKNHSNSTRTLFGSDTYTTILQPRSMSKRDESSMYYSVLKNGKTLSYSEVPFLKLYASRTSVLKRDQSRSHSWDAAF